VPEGRKNPLAQTVSGKLRVVPQVQGGRIRRGNDLDVEAIEQCAGPEPSVGHACGDLVIDRVSRLGAWDLVDPEYLDELVFQPIARGCAPEKLPVLAECAPDRPRIRLDWTVIQPRHAKASGLDAL
jgi:hypothetical protein